MKILVKFFASCRELCGKTSERFQLQDKATLRDLRSVVMSMHPILENMRAYLLISLNETFVTEQTELKEGDVVAFFPPVSGG